QKTVKAGIPAVNVWYSSPVVDNVPSVISDVDAIARMAADHLIARGFRNFGYVGYYQNFSRDIGAVIKARLKDAGYPCSSVFVSDRYNTSSDAWSRCIEKLENWVDEWTLPIGIFTSQDELGRLLTTVCEYRGVAIPHEAALLGMHNEASLCQLAEPSLSSVDVGYGQIGFHGAELLHELLQGKSPPDEPILHPPDFLESRQSTDAYVVKDPLIAEALRFISEHSHEPIKVDDVARGVNVTRRTLDRRFAEQGGRSVAQELTWFRIQRLTRLLVQTDQPIKYLAHEAGFKDAVQMCTVFRRIEGLSPTAFRRQHRTE
ncbi:MAG: substrate-binding domain-containing protein, partial [Verrucomicrobiota bacterium]